MLQWSIGESATGVIPLPRPNPEHAILHVQETTTKIAAGLDQRRYMRTRLMLRQNQRRPQLRLQRQLQLLFQLLQPPQFLLQLWFLALGISKVSDAIPIRRRHDSSQ